jgi:hypothetical protein
VASVFNERTGEYALIPILQRRLAQHFGWAAPLFYWGNREGSRAARAAHGNLALRLVAVFIRRPKVSSTPGHVDCRINLELIEYHQNALASGIFSFAAFPAVGSIPELWADPRVLLLRLDQMFEVTFSVGLSPTLDCGQNFEGSIDHEITFEDVVERISRKSVVFSYGDAMSKIAELRSTQERGRLGFLYMIGGYKPVHFLLPAYP